MFRRRKLTAQEKADLKWERKSSQPKTMGLVGIFNDLTPSYKETQNQINVDRSKFDDQAIDGDGPVKITRPQKD